MSEDISFLIERLQHLIPEAIMIGIQQGFETKRRRVLYQKYERVEKSDLRGSQGAIPYAWSEEEYEGVFLEFAHFDGEDIESEMIIETPDGRLVGAPLSHCRFIVDL